jgi:hypothetical protein
MPTIKRSSTTLLVLSTIATCIATSAYMQEQQRIKGEATTGSKTDDSLEEHNKTSNDGTLFRFTDVAVRVLRPLIVGFGKWIISRARGRLLKQESNNVEPDHRISLFDEHNSLAEEIDDRNILEENVSDDHMHHGPYYPHQHHFIGKHFPTRNHFFLLPIRELQRINSFDETVNTNDVDYFEQRGQ